MSLIKPRISEIMYMWGRMCRGSDAGKTVGQGGQQEQKGTYYLRSTNPSQKWRGSEALFWNFTGYASHSYMIALSNQILLAFSLYDLRCIILTIRKQITALKKGTFAPPAPPNERQEGRMLPLPPLRRAFVEGHF